MVRDLVVRAPFEAPGPGARARGPRRGGGARRRSSRSSADDLGARARDREALLGTDPQLDLVAAELDVLVTQSHRHGPASFERARRRRGVEGSKGVAHQRRALAEAGPEGTEVRVQLVGEDVAQLVRELDVVDVELLLDDAGRRRRGPRWQEDQRPAQGLADLDACFGARRAAERDERSGGRHAGLEDLVDECRDRRRASRRGAPEVSGAASRRPSKRWSARNGQRGASRTATRSSTSRSVACADSVSMRGASGSVRQKRRRDRRTYQLEHVVDQRCDGRRCGQRARSRPAPRSPHASSPSSLDSTQRSSSGRASGSGIAGSSGSKPLSAA